MSAQSATTKGAGAPPQSPYHSLYTDETPEEVRSATGLHLITQSTPNGKKVQILLEELALLYGTEWTTSFVNISTDEQKKDWFLRINPNGRIPVIIDNANPAGPPWAVMETSAELIYLQERFDRDGALWFKDPIERSQAVQWLFFWHGSGAPYQGQVGHFSRLKEKIPYAIERYRNETLRVFGVLEIHLSGKFTGQTREYLAGAGAGKYSIADIATWPWVSAWPMISVFKQEDMDKFPHLLKWVDRISQRPAVKTGISSKYALPEGK